jgi:exopolysaccharide biosynthesis polyprenyl glycosylphosphotransferase
VNPVEITRQSAQAVPLHAPPSGAPAVGAAAPAIAPPADASRLERVLESGFLRPAMDLAALTAALAAVVRWPGAPVPLQHAWPIVLFPLVVMLMLLARGMYTPRLRPTVLDGVIPVVGSISVATMAVVVINVYLAPSEMAPAVAVHLWVLSVALLGGGRTVLIAAQRLTRARGMVGRPTLIVGAGHVGRRIARRLDEHREYGLRPIGFLDADPLMAEAGTDTHVPVLGSPDDLDWIAQLTRAEHVVVAFSSEPDERLVYLIRRCEDLGLEVSLVPRLFESLNHRAAYEAVGGTPLMRLRSVHPKGWEFALKHALDRLGAVLLLVVFAPLMLAIAAAVRISSRGPALFRQRRVGRDGRDFDLLKFRSMAEPRASSASFAPARGSAPGGVEGDDRRTRIGRFLRRTSLDELPQLINVLRGDMSLVGPRPERPEFVELFQSDIKRYDDRLRVRSGITGWAQVHGLRGQTSLADRVEWDNYYIEHWSLALDVKILVLTVVAVLRAAE